MINFFRKIRKQLADDNKPLKYMRYAIGEIVLVVIGILIALSINNWNEWRKERTKEVEILTALAENLTINIQSVEAHIEELNILNKSSKIILSVLDNNLSYNDSLDKHFHKSRVSKSDLHISQGGYEQYKQSGFAIIGNKVLKNEIINFFESTYPVFYIGFRQINEQYVPFVDHHVPLFIFRRGELKPIDFQALCNDKYFISWIRAYMEGRNSLIIEETRFLADVKRVHQLIMDELGESDVE